jgi:transcription-repair coupling factor (superfamily II helicase)
MQIDALAQLMAMHPEVDVLSQALSRKSYKHFLLSGLYASAQAIILCALHRQLANNSATRPMVIVLDDSDKAQYMYADIKTLIDERDVYFFPCSHRRRQRTDETLTV